MLMNRRPCANESIVPEEIFPMTISGYSVSQTTIVRLWAAKFFYRVGVESEVCEPFTFRNAETDRHKWKWKYNSKKVQEAKMSSLSCG